jgi:hypothetical protein
VNENETIALLALIAAYDQRTVGQADVAAWHTIATECGWTFPLARRAVIEHHKSGGDRPRIKPGHITDAIQAARELIRKQVFQRDLVPPRELGDDVRAELAWRRRHIAEVTERALTAWAEDQPLPQIEAESSSEPERDVEGLVGGTFRMPRGAP